MYCFTAHRWRRQAAMGFAGALLAGACASAFAQSFLGPFPPGGPGWQDNADPATTQRRTEGMVRMMLAEVNATPEQERRIADILAATANELRPLRRQHVEARRRAMELLSQPAVDRQALEALRAQELAAAEQASRRMTQAMVDAAEVLSPEQRAKLAERMRQRFGMRG
jgi:Spy/CpxP family protein refolding chaperone